MSGDLIPDERGRVIIRRASLEDLDDVVTIWTDGQICQCNIPIEHEKAMGLFRGRIQSQTDCYGVWVAECDGVVVGWQSLTTGRANPTHRWAESSTYIRKENAGRGIGRRLLTFITQHAKSVGLTHIEGFIKKENEPPIRIVESLGWTKVGDIPRAQESDPEWLYYVYAVHRG